MTTAILVALVLSGDSLGAVKLGGLAFKAPTDWTKTEDETSKEWQSPDEKGKLAVSVFPVDPVRPAKACLGQMLEAVGKEGFQELLLGNQPASKKVTTDFVGEGGEEAKKDENKVTTTTVLGCNGKVKWVMTYTAKTADAARFGPILKRVMDSVSYGK